MPTIEAALWGEGLVTFASWRMNPNVSLDVALFQPGIPEMAKPHLCEIAQALLDHLGTVAIDTAFATTTRAPKRPTSARSTDYEVVGDCPPG